MLAAVQGTMILQSHATAPAYPPSSFLVKMPFHINVKARAGGRQSGVFFTILSSHNIARGTSREYSQLQQVTSPPNAHQCVCPALAHIHAFHPNLTIAPRNKPVQHVYRYKGLQ